jgi:hypothetical protein
MEKGKPKQAQSMQECMQGKPGRCDGVFRHPQLIYTHIVPKGPQGECHVKADYLTLAFRA